MPSGLITRLKTKCLKEALSVLFIQHDEMINAWSNMSSKPLEEELVTMIKVLDSPNEEV